MRDKNLIALSVLSLVLCFSAGATPKELFAGQTTAEKDFLWGSFWISEGACQQAPLNEEKQQKLCSDPTLDAEVLVKTNTVKENCDSIGGDFSSRVQEQREIATKRDIIPVVCRISCKKIINYSCVARDSVEVETIISKAEGATPLEELENKKSLSAAAKEAVVSANKVDAPSLEFLSE